jgi:hypothetical protein
MKSAVVLGTIVIGFTCVFLSFAWGSLFPATRSWTPEKGTRMSEIKAKLNDLSFKMASPASSRIKNGPDPAALKKEYDDLRAEFETLKTEFESVAETPKTTSRVLKWSGVTLALIGVIGWYAVSQSN